MTTQSDVMEHSLTREELLAIKNRRTGMLIFQISWIMVFLCLVFVHFQLRNAYTTWPPEGVERMNPLPGIAATIGLFVSAVLARRGLRAVQDNQLAAFFSAWRLAIVLGAAFVAVMLFEFIRVQMGTQYGTLFRVMTAFHSVHAVAVGIYMINVYRNAQKGMYSAANSWSIEAAAKLWYFVAIAWILFYVPLYWI
jgi:heme/copper-type cytochrome/quinol oxidase subunit 3